MCLVLSSFVFGFVFGFFSFTFFKMCYIFTNTALAKLILFAEGEKICIFTFVTSSYKCYTFRNVIND